MNLTGTHNQHSACITKQHTNYVLQTRTLQMYPTMSVPSPRPPRFGQHDYAHGDLEQHDHCGSCSLIYSIANSAKNMSQQRLFGRGSERPWQMSAVWGHHITEQRNPLAPALTYMTSTAPYKLPSMIGIFGDICGQQT